jgi:hypothetical protein
VIEIENPFPLQHFAVARMLHLLQDLPIVVVRRRAFVGVTVQPI